MSLLDQDQYWSKQDPSALKMNDADYSGVMDSAMKPDSNSSGTGTDTLKSLSEYYKAQGQASQPGAAGNPVGDSVKNGVMAGAMTGNPYTAGIVAGTSLVSGLMSERARREKEDMANEMLRRSRLENQYAQQGDAISSALKNQAGYLEKALA